MHRVLLLAALLGPALPTIHAQRDAANARVAPSADAKAEPAPKPVVWKNASDVEIKASDSVELHASFFEPEKSNQLAPGAILVHDSGGDRAQLMELGEKLFQSGFAVLVLDLRGHGKSGPKDLRWAKLDDDGRVKLWADAVRDLDAAAKWLRARKDVHATNLNMIGLRAGAGLAARHSLRDENVRAVALLEPRPEELGIDLAGDLQELSGLPTYIVANKEEKTATEAMVEEAHQVSGHPFIELVIASAPKDEAAPPLDRKTVTNVAKWMKQRAFPQK